METSSASSAEDLRMYDENEVPDLNENAWRSTNEFLVVSLFDDFTSSDAEDVWEHMRHCYNFDLNALRHRIPDFHDWKRIALINFLRRSGNSLKPADVVALIPRLAEMEAEWNIEENLAPVRENDRLLWELPRNFDMSDTSDDDLSAHGEGRNKKETKTPDKRIDVTYEMLSSIIQQNLTGNATSSVDAGKLEPAPAVSEDQTYFDSYSSLDIHREMVLDSSRTRAYRDFVLGNRDLFKNKIVLDVGCGSGILSMFCAQAGARLVVGIDAAASTVRVARDVVADNGFECIQLIDGKLEHMNLWCVESPDGRLTVIDSGPNGTEAPAGATPFVCDILISEWMGYALLYEWMLSTVLYARDRYLHSSGLMVPSRACMQVWAADFSQSIHDQLETWDDHSVYNLNLQRLKPDPQLFFTTPEVIVVPCGQIVSSPCTFLNLDLKEVTIKAIQQLRSPFVLSADTRMTSLVFSFFCAFEAPPLSACTSNPVILDTSPMTKPTHWRQTVCHLQAFEKPERARFVTPKGVGETNSVRLSGVISLAPASGKTSRHLSIIIEPAPVVVGNAAHFVPLNIHKFVLK